MAIIAPSVLAADFGNLQRDIEMINNSNADWFHIDIMDGVFVPNISFGFPIMETLKKHAKKTLDVHLMITQPERYIQDFKDAGADILTVHQEACPHIHRTIQQIKEKGMKAGVALNPGTAIDTLDDVFENLDMVLIMSVNPGFGGQKFIQNTIRKVEKLKEKISKLGLKTLIEIDGGVNLETGQSLINAGADALVAGSFVFSSENPSITIGKLKNL
jgi:ribulose-phosphate 3-epimerase